MNVKQVLELFVEQGIIDHNAQDDLQQEVMKTGKSLAQVMVDFGVCSETEFYQHIAAALGLDFVDLTDFEPPQELLRMIPAGHAILHKALPLGLDGNIIQLTLGDPFNMQTVEDLRFALGKEIQVVVAPVWQIEEAIKKHYGTDAGSMDEILAQLGGDVEFGGPEGTFDLKNLEAEANARQTANGSPKGARGGAHQPRRPRPHLPQPSGARQITKGDPKGEQGAASQIHLRHLRGTPRQAPCRRGRLRRGQSRGPRRAERSETDCRRQPGG